MAMNMPTQGSMYKRAMQKAMPQASMGDSQTEEGQVMGGMSQPGVSYPSAENLAYSGDRHSSKDGGGGPTGSPEFQALKKRYSTYMSQKV